MGKLKFGKKKKKDKRIVFESGIKVGEFIKLPGGMIVGDVDIKKLSRRKVRFRRMDALQLHALHVSVDKLGMKDAIVVVPGKKEGHYEIVDGHHRLDEAKKQGIKNIPAVLLTDRDGEIVDASEADLSMHRFNLSAHTEGEEFLQVVHEMSNDGIPLEDIAAATAKEVEAIAELTKDFADELFGGSGDTDSDIDFGYTDDDFDDATPFGAANADKPTKESSRGVPIILTLPGTSETEELLDRAKETFQAKNRQEGVILALKRLFEGE